MIMIRAFLHNESGSTAIEYALIASFIALVLISAVKGVGTRLNAKFQAISNAIS